MADRCRLCGRGRNDASVYCSFHQRAHAGLADAFERWRTALDIDWIEFLKEVRENPGTGEWAAEVAEDLLETGHLKTP